MQNLMNAQNITLSGGETIDSQQLLVMVNETRKDTGLRRNGLSDAKCRQLVMAWNIPYKKVPHVVPGGPITQMSVVDEEAFKNALDKMMLRAEKRRSQGYHPKMGRFSVTA